MQKENELLFHRERFQGNGLVFCTLGQEAGIGTTQAFHRDAENPQFQVALVTLAPGEARAAAQYALEDLQSMGLIAGHLENQVINAIELAFKA